eukprot:2281235-Rhodomonas_salina.2
MGFRQQPGSDIRDFSTGRLSAIALIAAHLLYGRASGRDEEGVANDGGATLRNLAARRSVW